MNSDVGYIRVGNRAERRARRRGWLDACRGRGPAHPTDVPAFGLQLVNELLASLAVLGADVQAAVGRPNAQVEECATRACNLQGALAEQQGFEAGAKDTAEATDAGDPSSSSPKAQAHRHADNEAARTRSIRGALDDTRTELARLIFERRAVVEPFRERARQVQGIFLAQQHAYWGALRRWWRTRKHGPCPEEVIPDAPTPGWIVDDVPIYGRSMADLERETGLR